MVESECIESWKKFSAYMPLGFLVNDSVYEIVENLKGNLKIADLGGGNPLNPQSSSYMLNSILKKSKNNFLLDVYDLNGEPPEDKRVNFIKGAVQESLNSFEYYDFALSVNALQAPSIPFNFQKKIHEILKTDGILLMLLPKKEQKCDFFKGIESIIKQYPPRIYERRYDEKNIKYYFPAKSWHIEKIKSLEFSGALEKKMLDFYFSDMKIRRNAEIFAKEYVSCNEKSAYLKKKLEEYFSLSKDSEFKPIIIQSEFLEILSKKI